MRIIACFASTLDGKIASSHNLRDRIGSTADLAHLLTVRNQADAILCGGETFRQHASIRKGSQQTEAPLQIIMTRQFNLPPASALFQKSTQMQPPTPILIVSPTEAHQALHAQYPSHVEWFTLRDECGLSPLLETLRHRGIQTLMVEGGGHIFNLFLQEQAVHELYLTLCPLLLGGIPDPTLVTGQGFTVAQAPRTEVLKADWREQELYLHLRIHYPL